MIFNVSKARAVPAARVRTPVRARIVRVRADAQPPYDKGDGTNAVTPDADRVKTGEDTVRGGEEQLDVDKAAQAKPDDQDKVRTCTAVDAHGTQLQVPIRVDCES